MNDSSIIELNNPNEFRDMALYLASHAQRQITILTPDLEPDIYGNIQFIELAIKLIKYSRYTRIRILTLDTKYLSERHHHLLKLFRQAEEQADLRKISALESNTKSAYFIVDDHSIIRRQNHYQYKGFCYINDRATVKDQMDEFDLLWGTGSRVPDLRQITL